jgi:hypothetical protein
LSTRTLRLIHQILERAIRHAQARDKVRRNVASLVDVPEGKEGRPSKAMTLAQATKLLNVVEPDSEEDFRLGKSGFGLADSQVRRHTALTRHLALALAALAVCATTAALASPRTSMLPRPPASPDDLPPADPGLIPLTVAEIKRIFNLLTRTGKPSATTCTGPGGGADDGSPVLRAGSTQWTPRGHGLPRRPLDSRRRCPCMTFHGG